MLKIVRIEHIWEITCHIRLQYWYNQWLWGPRQPLYVYETFRVI